MIYYQHKNSCHYDDRHLECRQTELTNNLILTVCKITINVEIKSYSEYATIIHVSECSVLCHNNIWVEYWMSINNWGDDSEYIHRYIPECKETVKEYAPECISADKSGT